MIKTTTGDGITKVQWDRPENNDELRSVLKALVDAEYEGDFARASEIAERVANQILDNSDGAMTVGDSPEYFARRILQGIRVAHDAIAKGDADLAAMMAFHAGVAWERARMKWLWEDHALRGTKFQKKSGETLSTEMRISFLSDVASTKNPVSYDALAYEAEQAGAISYWPESKNLTNTVRNFAKKKKILG